jgi:hypothetical protein
MNPKLVHRLVVLAIVLGYIAVGAWACSGPSEPSADEIERAFYEEVGVGGSAEAIELFFKRKGMRYAWNPLQERYNANLRQSRGWSIAVDVFVDAQRRAVRIEALRVGTSI